MKEKSLFLQLVGDAPLFRVLDFLVDNKGMDFTKKDVYEGAGISKATLFKHWKEFERYDLVKPTRRFGKTQLYTINSSNPLIKKILDIESVLIRQSMEKGNKIRISKKEAAVA